MGDFEALMEPMTKKGHFGKIIDLLTLVLLRTGNDPVPMWTQAQHRLALLLRSVNIFKETQQESCLPSPEVPGPLTLVAAVDPHRSHEPAPIMPMDAQTSSSDFSS